MDKYLSCDPTTDRARSNITCLMYKERQQRPDLMLEILNNLQVGDAFGNYNVATVIIVNVVHVENQQPLIIYADIGVTPQEREVALQQKVLRSAKVSEFQNMCVTINGNHVVHLPFVNKFREQDVTEAFVNWTLQAA